MSEFSKLDHSIREVYSDDESERLARDGERLWLWDVVDEEVEGMLRGRHIEL